MKIEATYLMNKDKAIWSWDYNYGKAFPWPCNKCGALVEMEKISIGNPINLVKCPNCGFKQKRKY